MAAPDDNFSAWLSKRLSDISCDIDVELFVSYISGILDEDDTPRDDKLESLAGFLVEVVPESDVGFISESIMKTYESMNHVNKEEDEGNNLDDKLSALMEKQKLNIPTTKQKTASNVTNKQAILAQYAQVSDGEETDSEDEATGASGRDTDLQKNLNASKVDSEQREYRDKMKQASDAKKEKDKLDRERQKQLKQEKADKAKQKTQKQERRR